MKLFSFIFGARRVSVPNECGALLLNICMKYRYAYYEMGSCDKRTYVAAAPGVAARLYSRLISRGVKAELGELCGLPAYLLRCFRRGGLVLGVLCAALLVAFSQDHVWDIRVEGYDGCDTAAVIEELRECGFYKGASLTGFSADEVENLFLRRSEDIGWISVNVKGTVAYVEVQKKNTPPPTGPILPANVVAAYDGQVVEVITYNGLRMVEVGETVRQGQLLISGAYGEKTPGLHVTRAAGRVSARTFRTLFVKIPLEYEEKSETGRVFCEKFIIFFTNRVKVFSNYRNLGSTCDKIVEVKDLEFLGSSLPVGVETESYVEYETVKKTRTKDEALALAKEQLEAMILKLGAEEICERTENVFFADDACMITCELTCIENIAKTVEFNADIEGNS